MEETLRRHGPPEVFNTDRRAQFTATAFTDVLKRHQVQISMDGKGRWMDNVFVERLWRSVIGLLVLKVLPMGSREVI